MTGLGAWRRSGSPPCTSPTTTSAPARLLDETHHRVQTVASVPALAVAAEATTTLRIGSRMFCIGYHQPVVLAKEAATLDFFSEGRLEHGLGAGWLENEYVAMGIPFPSSRASGSPPCARPSTCSSRASPAAR